MLKLSVGGRIWFGRNRIEASISAIYAKMRRNLMHDKLWPKPSALSSSQKYMSPFGYQN